MISHSTNQKATTSSHTMLPGSSVLRWRAVTVQAHQPTPVDTAISTPICPGVSHSCSSR